MSRHLKTPRRRATTLAAVLVVLGLAAAALAASTASGSRSDTVTLRVGLFGDFGYHDLYVKYEKAHPNIDIKEDIESYPDHHSNLAKHLAVGSGADDIESVEVGFISQFKSQPNLFANLNKMGAKSLQKQWLDWKWRQSIAPNGAQIGLGTDVGSLAICYRRDLFKKAGLPTDRKAVSALWPTWQKFVAVGKRFQQHAPKGISFIDSGSNVFNAIIGQLNPAYYDSHGKVVVGSNPKVKTAWKQTMSAIQAHESAGLAAFSNDWNTGYKKGTFATVTCPAWMMGYIQGQAPKSKGKWDIASVPGRRRQLGRLVPDRPEAGFPPEGGLRPGEVPHLARVRGLHLQADRQPAEPACALQEQGDHQLQEPVLQQRSGRKDLHGLGEEAEAADHRPASGRHPDRCLERDPACRAAQAEPG